MRLVPVVLGLEAKANCNGSTTLCPPRLCSMVITRTRYGKKRHLGYSGARVKILSPPCLGIKAFHRREGIIILFSIFIAGLFAARALKIRCRFGRVLVRMTEVTDLFPFCYEAVYLRRALGK